MRVDPQSYSDRRDVPKYTPAEVALYIGIKESTLRNWFFGYSKHIRNETVFYRELVKPAIHNPHGPSLSFFNLAEAHVLAATRQDWSQEPKAAESSVLTPAAHPRFGSPSNRLGKPIKISMQAIRHAIAYISDKFPSPHPLITNHFYTNGKQLFIKIIEGDLGAQLVINLSQLGQLGFESILDAYLKRIDRDSQGMPLKVYPLRNIRDDDRSIVIMSNVASGRPTIAGTGVRAEAVWHRSQAGESVSDLSDDYGIDPSVIEKAISYFASAKAA